jgi:hypothetical protein
VFNPLLTKTMKKPVMVTWRHSIGRAGNAPPAQIREMIDSNTPAVMNRIPENSAGGRVWTAIW